MKIADSSITLRGHKGITLRGHNNDTVRVAYYEPAYYKHLFIMNQAEGPNRYILIAFVLNQVRLI